MKRAVPHTVFVFALGFVVAGTSGCGGASGPNDEPDPTWTSADATLTPTPSPAPVSGLPAGVQFLRAVPYGSDGEQVFDAFLPAASKPTALVLWVHGGGFVAGSRTDAYGSPDRVAELQKALTAGVAWMTIDYRLLGEVGVETVGVQKSLRDTRRALQFVRYHAATFNIDPQRIVMYGESAGAGTSVWLAFHDEMAESSNDDRIARQSTRLKAAAGLSTQGTYDVLRWAPDVFGPEYDFVTNDLLLSVQSSVQLLLRFYGLPAALGSDTTQLVATLNNASYATYRADLDMFVLASHDDPPLLLRTLGDDISPLAAGFDVLHHPLHPKTLYEKSQAAGVPTLVADVPAYDLSSSEDTMDFLLGYL